MNDLVPMWLLLLMSVANIAAGLFWYLLGYRHGKQDTTDYMKRNKVNYDHD